jgi:hypothetical protein
MFRVLDLGNRWASCGAKGTLNFNWRTVMAPVWVFDYILVHELAHMIQKGHTKEFWRIVSRIIPDYQEHEAWLQERGVELDIYENIGIASRHLTNHEVLRNFLTTRLIRFLTENMALPARNYNSKNIGVRH